MEERRTTTASLGALKLRRAEEKVVIQYPTRAASFKRLLGRAPSLPFRASLEHLPQRIVDGRGVFELCGDIGIQDNDIRALAKARRVLSTHAGTEVVFRTYLVA